MSAKCQNFVQNAWKKELCSNCFKSKDEHNLKAQSKLALTLATTKTTSIIKPTPIKQPLGKPKRNVNFNNQLVEIIGYGGEDWSDEEQDVEVYEESLSDDNESHEEDEKELIKLTKENTNFNACNLGEFKSYAQLKLGKPQVDADGKKQTLLVSVTPFGQTNKTPASKDSEKSLLEEITETLENSKNPIQIMSRKKIQKEITLSVPLIAQNLDLQGKRCVNLQRNHVIKRDEKPPVMMLLKNAKNDGNNNNKLTVDSDDKTSNESLSADDSSSHCSSEESAKDEDSSDSSSSSFNQATTTRDAPDGRADPDAEVEPPALPLTPPPPLEQQLPVTINEKPKIPIKPSTILIRKTPPIIPGSDTHAILTTFQQQQQQEVKLTKQDSNGSDVAKSIINKRRAPKPPPNTSSTQCGDESSIINNNISTIYTRNVNSAIIPSDSPCVREKEKRERLNERRSLSLSTDSLVDDKKKRARFSLKKFLRMGSSNKELNKIPISVDAVDEAAKPRLVIVHPLDLNTNKVEVLDKVVVNKPPPPPRHYDEVKPLIQAPKPIELLNKHKLSGSKVNVAVVNKTNDCVYANIGEVRSAITPNKPQRTASMREREAAAAAAAAAASSYEPVEINKSKSSENVYDYITNGRSSSPECNDNGNNKASPKMNKVENGVEYYKFQNIPRSMSLTYCGSETESEIYSPYSCYGSESEIAEDDEWNSNGRTHKLRSRKGRSIVHKNLEDNYGAVVIANHEALAQVLENIQHSQHLQPALRGLKTATNLRWSDFIIRPTLAPVQIGARIFHQAMWGAQHVTLVISAGSLPTSPLSLGTYSLVPITEFSDLIPVKYLPSCCSISGTEVKHLQATVAVLPCMQVNTIQSYGEQLKVKSGSAEDVWKDASFVLLQMVNALKTLQAQGIEELPLSLTSFVLCKDVEKESHSRLCVLQGLGEELVQKQNANDDNTTMGTLCMCVSTALKELDPNAKLAPLLSSLLNTERAISLTQVKSVLEFSLWGPSDVALGNTIRERELALQRWLDLQRATVLHGLVCTKVQLTVYEECHLLFLVRSNAKMMCDASLLLDCSSKQQNLLTTK